MRGVLSFDCVEGLEFGIKMKVMTFDIYKLYEYFKISKDCFVLEYYIKKYKYLLPGTYLYLSECYDNYNMIKLILDNCFIADFIKVDFEIIFKLKDIKVIELFLNKCYIINIQSIYFIDCNKEIYDLLKKLILSGHNINFDYEEFKYCDYDMYFDLDKVKIQEIFLLVDNKKEDFNIIESDDDLNEEYSMFNVEYYGLKRCYG